MSSPDYDTRAKEYGFAPKEVLLKTVQQSNVVLLDVRRPEEIEETGSFQLPNQQSWVNSSCTPTACPELEAKAEELLPDKNGTYTSTRCWSVPYLLMHDSRKAREKVCSQTSPPT